MKHLISLFATALLFSANTVFAHGSEVHSSAATDGAVKEQKEWGIAGDRGSATRTIDVRMLDSMRFVPDRIDVRQGETVRLRIANAGKAMHEYVLGTKKYLDEHAEMMKKFPNMEHDEPYMAHVAPGKRSEIIWTFNRLGEFDFGCLLPGHYEAGMVGKVQVR